MRPGAGGPPTNASKTRIAAVAVPASRGRDKEHAMPLRTGPVERRQLRHASLSDCLRHHGDPRCGLLAVNDIQLDLRNAARAYHAVEWETGTNWRQLRRVADEEDVMPGGSADNTR